MEKPIYNNNSNSNSKPTCIEILQTFQLKKLN